MVLAGLGREAGAARGLVRARRREAVLAAVLDRVESVAVRNLAVVREAVPRRLAVRIRRILMAANAHTLEAVPTLVPEAAAALEPRVPMDR